MQGSEVRRGGDVDKPRHPRKGQRSSLYERRDPLKPRRTERRLGLVERPRSLLGGARQSSRAEHSRPRARTTHGARSHREIVVERAKQSVREGAVEVVGREDNRGKDPVGPVRPDRGSRQQAVHSSVEESRRRIVACTTRSPFSAEEAPPFVLASRGSSFRREGARIRRTRRSVRIEHRASCRQGSRRPGRHRKVSARGEGVRRSQEHEQLRQRFLDPFKHLGGPLSRFLADR